MDQHRGLEGVTGAFMGHAFARNGAQLPIHLIEQGSLGVLVAL